MLVFGRTLVKNSGDRDRDRYRDRDRERERGREREKNSVEHPSGIC